MIHGFKSRPALQGITVIIAAHLLYEHIYWRGTEGDYDHPGKEDG